MKSSAFLVSVSLISHAASDARDGVHGTRGGNGESKEQHSLSLQLIVSINHAEVILALALALGNIIAEVLELLAGNAAPASHKSARSHVVEAT